MRQPHGYARWFGSDGPTVEADTAQCAHCQHTVFVKPSTSPTDLGGWCGRCAAFICGPCADLGKCTPFEKEVERQEARHRFLRSAGLL